jgi:hypothetical protein
MGSSAGQTVILSQPSTPTTSTLSSHRLRSPVSNTHPTSQLRLSVSQHPYPWHLDGVAQSVLVSTSVFVVGTLVSLAMVPSSVLVAVTVSVFVMVTGL